MNYKNELDFMPGIYKCFGDIANLRFKIRLEILKSSMIPLSNMEETESGNDPQYFEREEFEFSWNEKMFSSHEFELYSDELHCNSTLEKEYHQQITNMKNKYTNPLIHRLFTYTSRDDVPQNLHRNIFYNEEFGKFTFLSNSTTPQIQHTSTHTSSETQDARFRLPMKNIVDYNPSDVLRRQNRSLSRSYEIMYIVADLCDKNTKSEFKTDKCKNYLLFTIIWNKRTSTLSVMPDFASFSTPGYKIDGDKLSDTRYVYRYWLINLSSNEEPNIYKSNEKLGDHVASHQASNFSLDFELPCKSNRVLFTFIDIQKAVGFHCDNLFIRYYIDTPSSWMTDKPDLQYGVTQQCRLKKANYTAFFSHLFEIKLLQEMTDSSEEIKTEIQLGVPQIFLEVCSLDSWGRFRVEGYVWLPLPIISGFYKFNLNSWRPASCSRRDDLKRFFVGLYHEISDITYPGSSNNTNSLLGRYGFNTMSSGCVHLTIHVIQQNCPSLPPVKALHSVNTLKMSKLMNNVNSILEAFKKAREKMMLARDPMSVNYSKE